MTRIKLEDAPNLGQSKKKKVRNILIGVGALVAFGAAVAIPTTIVLDQQNIEISISMDGGSVDTQTVKRGTLVSSFNVPTKEGYTFAGWYSSPDFSEETRILENTVFTEDTTIYACFVKNEITYSYFVDGIGYSFSIPQDSTLADLTPPTKEGFVFTGWYSSADLTEDTLLPNDTVITNNMQLYAKFVKSVAGMVVYDIVIDGVSTEYQIAEGATIGDLEAPNKEDYIFEGWYSSATFEENTLLANDTVLTNGMTLYPKYIVSVASNISFTKPTITSPELEELAMIIQYLTLNKTDGSLYSDSDLNNFKVGQEFQFKFGASGVSTIPPEVQSMMSIFVIAANGNMIQADENGVYTVELQENTDITIAGFFIPVPINDSGAIVDYYEFFPTENIVFPSYILSYKVLGVGKILVDQEAFFYIEKTDGTFYPVEELNNLSAGDVFQFKIGYENLSGEATEIRSGLVFAVNGNMIQADENGVYTVELQEDTDITIAGAFVLDTMESGGGDPLAMIGGYYEFLPIENMIIPDYIMGSKVVMVQSLMNPANSDNPYNTSIKTITLPKYCLMYIPAMLSMTCTNLEQIIIPEDNDSLIIKNGLVYLDFQKYLELAGDSLDGMPTDIDLTKIDFILGVYDNTIKEVTIDNEYVIINSGAFAFSNLEEININATHLEMSGAAFMMATNLKTVNITGQINIGDDAFQGCTSLTEVNLVHSTENVDLIIGRDIFQGCNMELLQTNLTIQAENVSGYNIETLLDTEINSSLIFEVPVTLGDSLFEGNTEIESITIRAPEGERVVIGNRTFANCTNLKSITIVGDVTINSNAFANCTNLSQVTLGTNVSIGRYAFSGCTSLTSIDLSGASSISSNAFENCTNLSQVTLGTNVSIWSYAFSGCTSLTSIDLSGVSSIGSSAFANCTSLTSIDLSGAKSIDSSAFANCTSLTSIDLSGVSSISSNAFENCTSLSQVTLGTNVSIENYAFSGCTSLASIDLSGVNSIGSSAFANCTSLSQVTLEGDTDIGSNAFENCTSLQNIDLSKVTGSVYMNAFAGCSALQDFIFNGYVPSSSIDFSGCTNLTSVIIEQTNTSSIYITDTSFTGCDNLTEISIEGEIEGIEENSFNLTKLESLTLKSTKTSNTTLYDFLSNTNLKKIDISLSTNTSITYDLTNNTNLEYFAFLNSNSNPTNSITINFPSVCNFTAFMLKGNFTFNDKILLNQSNLDILYLNLNRNGTQLSSEVSQYLEGLTDLSVKFFNSIFNPTEDITIELQDLDTIIISTDSRYRVTIEDNYLDNYTHAKNLTFVGPFDLDNVNFSRFANLTTLNIENEGWDYTSVPRRAFADITTLTSVDINGYVNVGSECFTGCVNLTECSLAGDYGDKTTVGSNAFANTPIKSLKIYDYVTIGANAFEGIKITSLYLNRMVGASLGSNAFLNCLDLTNVFIDNADINTTTFAGCTNIEKFELSYSGDTQITLTQDSFAGFTKLTTLILSGNILIDENCFSDCINLTEVSIKGGDTDDKNIVISKNAFANLSLQKIDIIGGYVNILTDAFANLHELKNVNIEGYLTFESACFTNSTNIESITINNSNSNNYITITKEFFAGLSNLTKITIKNYVTIASECFSDCVNLQECYIEGSSTYRNVVNVIVSDYAFKDCTSLIEANIQYAELGNYIFNNCSNLSEVFTENTTFATNAFNGIYSDNAHLKFSIFAELLDFLNNASELNFGEGALKYIYVLENTYIPTHLLEDSSFKLEKEDVSDMEGYDKYFIAPIINEGDV